MSAFSPTGEVVDPVAEMHDHADLVISSASSWFITDPIERLVSLDTVKWSKILINMCNELDTALDYTDGREQEIRNARRAINYAFEIWNKSETLRIAIVSAESNACSGREAIAIASRYF